jgi:hypothetical protein
MNLIPIKQTEKDMVPALSFHDNYTKEATITQASPFANLQTGRMGHRAGW